MAFFVELKEEGFQYNTIQYNTIQYNTIQYNTIQYNGTVVFVVEICEEVKPTVCGILCGIEGGRFSIQYKQRNQKLDIVFLDQRRIQYNTIRGNIQYNTIQYNTIVPHFTALTIQTIQYNTVQYSTIQYNTIQYNTI